MRLGKILKRLLGVMLAMITLAVVLGNAMPSGNAGGNKAELFVIPNTLRLKQDDDIPNYGYGSKVSVGVAKNETEGGQFIIYAAKTISSFHVGVTELKMPTGEVLPSENVEVFAERYMYVPNTKTMKDSIYTPGYYPDALVPMVNYVVAGDNSVKKGHNQAIWIDVSADSDTVAGTYTGKIIVNTDGETQYLDFSVTVYDFDITKTTHFKSAFNLWSNNAFYVDQFTTAHGYSNQKLYEKYYEYMVKYRAMPMDVPSLHLNDYELYAKDLYEYASREEVSAYTVPTESVGRVIAGTSVITVNTERLEELFVELIELSMEKQFDLFQKMYIYVPYHDEPHSTLQYEALRESSDGIENVKKKLVTAYANELSALGDFGVQLENSLLGVPNLITVMTVGILNDLAGYVDAWCINTENFMNASVRATAQEKREAGDEVWWYTSGNSDPTPNYMIHEHMLATRMMGWMSMENKIDGNLFWATNIFGACDVTKGTNYIYPRDLWEDPMSYPYNAGNGYLTYPGEKYNVDGPIGSLRLTMIRDGQEDYEYLYYLKTLLEKATASYGIDLDVMEYVEDLTARMFTKTRTVIDQEEFIRVREELVNLIYALQEENFSLIVNLNGKNATAQTQSVTVFAADGVEITVNGKTAQGIACGNGKAFYVNVPLDKNANEITVTAKKNEKTVTVVRNIGGRVQNLENFEERDDVNFLAKDGVETSLETNPENVLTGEKSLKVCVEESEVTRKNYIRFRSAKGYDFSRSENLNTIEFDVYNASDNTVIINFNTNLLSDISSFAVYGNQKTHISVNFAYFASSKMKDMSYFEVTFSNAQAELYFDEFYTTYRQFDRIEHTVKTSELVAEDETGGGQNGVKDVNGNLTLTGFEEDDVLQKVWFHNTYETYVSLQDSPKAVTEGGRALEVIYNGVSQFPGSYGQPSIRFYNMNQSFTGFYGGEFDLLDYKSFTFDVYNASDKAIKFSVQFMNARGKTYTEYVTVESGKKQSVNVGVDANVLNGISDTGAFGTLYYIQIGWDKPKTAQETALKFYLDNVKLMK